MLFPEQGEPRNVFEKLEDCAVIQQLCRITPRVSLHFPWDKVTDANAVRQRGEGLGIAGGGPGQELRSLLLHHCRKHVPAYWMQEK